MFKARKNFKGFLIRNEKLCNRNYLSKIIGLDVCEKKTIQFRYSKKGYRLYHTKVFHFILVLLEKSQITWKIN